MLELSIRKQLHNFTLEVDFSAEKGCIGILGASGCGKSMTLKCIAGIERPDSGMIRMGPEPSGLQEADPNLAGRILFDADQHINLKPQKRHVGYLFQNYALFPNMTVRQNIAVGIPLESGGRRSWGKRQRAYEEDTVERLLLLFQLKGLENRYPLQLSGGQQQRVALARIMASNPQILLLDEPFSAMDSFLREELREEMIKLLREEFGGLSLLVTHDWSEARQMCDHLILMEDGHIIQQGPTEEVFARPTSPMAARLIGYRCTSNLSGDADDTECAWAYMDTKS